MSDAIKKLHDYLAMSPSMVYPEDVLAYLPAIEAENAKLRELALGLKWCCENYGCESLCPLYDKSEQDHCREERLLRELRIEV